MSVFLMTLRLGRETFVTVGQVVPLLTLGEAQILRVFAEHQVRRGKAGDVCSSACSAVSWKGKSLALLERNLYSFDSANAQRFMHVELHITYCMRTS